MHRLLPFGRKRGTVASTRRILAGMSHGNGNGRLYHAYMYTEFTCGCVHVYVYTTLCTCGCVHIYVYTHRVYMCVCIDLRICTQRLHVCVYVSTYITQSSHVRVCTFAYMHTEFTCICVHIDV